MQMRRSRVLEKMRAGKVATSVKLNMADPVAAELAGMSGFDCVWLDMEHLPVTTREVEAQINAAKIHDMDALVRVKRGPYSNLIHPLEMDATGIMVPHLMSLEDARQIVYYSKFHPVGRRPIDGGYRDGAYTQLGMDDYMAQANDQRFVVVQIEDPEPLEDLEAIAQLEGIDVLFFGAGDFSQGIGAPGQWDHPRIVETRKRVAQAARKYGKFAGSPASLANARELADLGYQYITVGADVLGLAQYFQGISQGLAEALNL